MKQMARGYAILMWGLAAGSVGLFLLLLLCGTSDIPARDILAVIFDREDADPLVSEILVNLRLPMASSAFLAGMGLAVAGLLLQTAFSNPLAGPSILGVSTGASLGVAVMLLALGGGAGIGLAHNAGAFAGAVLGAGVMLAALLIFSRFVRGTAMLLIVGVLLGYLASSVISILNFYATEEGVHSFVIWGLGSFSGVTLEDLLFFGPVIIAGTIGGMMMVKPLNALLLGSAYAASLGVDLRRTRNLLLLISGVLTAAVTAFCGPIGFLGLVMPHVARLTTATSDHFRLLPATALWGGFSGLLCAAISIIAGDGTLLPVNAITPLLSVPVIIYVIVNRDRLAYFK